MRNIAKVHTNAVNLVLIELARLGVYAARREVGMFYVQADIIALKDAITMRRPAPILHPRKIGVEGEPDIQGIISPHGQAIGVEVKVGRDRLRPKQTAWAKMWVAKGGAHIVVRPDREGWADGMAKAIAECRHKR